MYKYGTSLFNVDYLLNERNGKMIEKGRERGRESEGKKKEEKTEVR